MEEGCVDLDPLSWPQAAESDGTGEPETTGLPVVAAWTASSHDFVRLPDMGAWDTHNTYIHTWSSSSVSVGYTQFPVSYRLNILSDSSAVGWATGRASGL